MYTQQIARYTESTLHWNRVSVTYFAFINFAQVTNKAFTDPGLQAY